MPTYEYHCTSCGHKMDIVQKITADPIKQCPHCQKETLSRGPGGGIGLAFNGSGFYVNDYPKSSGTCCPCNKGDCS